MRRREFLATGAAAVVLPLAKLTAFAAERRLLYIAEPGIRNYVEYGGVGVLVYDIGQGYTFVKRIPTWEVAAGAQPENVKGIAASAQDGKALRQHDQAASACIDLVTEKMVWEQGARGRLRPPGDLPGRTDPLCAVVRRPALERRRRDDRRRASRRW